MRTKHLITLLLLLTGSIFAKAQSGAVAGTVLDEKKQPLIGAVIEITQGGIAKGGASTDEDGKFIIKPLNPGRYDIKAKYTSYKDKMIKGLIVGANKTTTQNFNMEINTKSLNEVVVTGYKVPLVNKYGNSQTITAQEIHRMPTRSTNDIQSIQGGVYQQKSGEAVSIAGGRVQGTVYIIDGVQVNSKAGNRNRKKDKNASLKQDVYNTPTYYNPSLEDYTKVHENDFMNVKANPLSTLSVDVDRASYSNVRRFINEGQKPPADAIRIEEMINYFKYNYPQPRAEDPIAIVTELTDCPWNEDHQLLRVGMQAKTIETENLPASNLVFLIDVSGSMTSENKLPLVISSLKMLVKQLRSKDKVSIVVYAGNAGMVLSPTSGRDKQTISGALDRLEAGGSTAGGAGIQLAYKTAVENFIQGGNNRVILATDGDFNVGVSNNNELESLIVNERKKGIFLTCLGYGMGNYKDSKLETLADKGNGNYAYIDSKEEAEKTLVHEFGGTLFTVAKDVKAQIEFNPAYVQAYRLVGYENRLLNEEDFKDDKKDAGEMGSGHQVTILYEIVPAGIKDKHVRKTTDLKYQDRELVNDNSNNEFATIKFRYKQPDGNKSREMVHVIKDVKTRLEYGTEDTRFASAVAMFGMLLRDSKFTEEGDFDTVIDLAKSGKGEDEEGYRAEFIKLVKAVNNKTSIK